MTYVGSSVRRIEDRPLLTGSARFAADLSLPGQLHLRVVRSPVARGRIVGIDTAGALSLPGVEAVWTAADTGDIPPIDFRMPMITGVESYRQPVLAGGRVRYVGEPVAVVLADDPYLAEDAAEQVFVDIEELRPVVDPYLDGSRATEVGVVEKAYGDLAAAFAGDPVVVEMELRVGRHSAVPMETRGALARYDATSSTLEMFGAAKVPHYNRGAIARMLGLSPPRRWSCAKSTWGAVSECGESCIRRTSWSAGRPAAPGVRFAGSRTGGSTCWPPTTPAIRSTASAPPSTRTVGCGGWTPSSGSTRART